MLLTSGSGERTEEVRRLCDLVTPPLEFRTAHGASKPSEPAGCRAAEATPVSATKGGPAEAAAANISRPGMLRSDPHALRRWARQLVEQKETRRNHTRFVGMVTLHNLAWTGALLAFLG